MVTKKKYKYSLVEIDWVDAETEHGWEEVDYPTELPIATTVGFLIKEGKDKNDNEYLLIASTYADGQTNGRFKIPQNMVKTITVIKQKSPN